MNHLHLCSCGELLSEPVWHCPFCHHHWLFPPCRDTCKNCYKGKPPSKASTIPFLSPDRAFSGTNWNKDNLAHSAFATLSESASHPGYWWVTVLNAGGDGMQQFFNKPLPAALVAETLKRFRFEPFSAEWKSRISQPVSWCPFFPSKESL